MIFRHVIIKSAIKLSLKNNNLHILNRENEEIHLPLEDIAIVLIEDPHVVLTARLITECSKHGIALIFCDETFLPNTQTLPLNLHYNQYGIVNKQINLNKEDKARLWQQIIKSKIRNQYQVIELTCNDENAKSILSNYIDSVELNDKDNKEGIAAKVFFNALYGADFVRFGESSITKLLNYGYTILSSCMIRKLTSLGLNTNFGIWHESEKNPFNLAFDLIEPFRPIVDYYAYWNLDKLGETLTKEVRKDLVALLSKEVLIRDQNFNVEHAMEIVAKSYLDILEFPHSSKILKLPILKESIMYEFGDE